MLGYIGLGSNLGNRRAWLRRGLIGLRDAGLAPIAVSSVWESEPVGTREPMWFLNMAVTVRTGLAPTAVLDLLLRIEREALRMRRRRNGPRTLDLDLLMLGRRQHGDERLTLPHPRMWQRRFVLEPLAEIAPRLRDPRGGPTVADRCERLRATAVVRPAGRLELAGIIRPSTRSWRSAYGNEIPIDRR